MSDKPYDEYEIAPILERFNIDRPNVVEAIGDHLDKVISIYLLDAKRQRDSCHTETICYLQLLLIDCAGEDNASDIKDRIKKLIAEYEASLDRLQKDK